MSSSSYPGSLDSIGWDPNRQIVCVAMVIFSAVLWFSQNPLLAVLIVIVLFLPLPCIIVRLPYIQRKLLFHSWYYKADKSLKDPSLWGLVRGVNKPIGNVGCWFVPTACTCRRATTTCSCHSDTVVVYCHGSSGSRGNSYRVELVNFLSSLGCAVYTFDYRGYADSPGYSSQVHSVQDARAVLAVARAEHPDKRVVLYGHSMGTGVVCQTAYQLICEGAAVDAVVLEAPFLSIPDVILKSPVVRFINDLPMYRDFLWRFSDLFISKDVIGELENVLILFAENDEVIPVHHATELNTLCPGSTLLLTAEGGHNFLIQQDSVKEAIRKHLKRRD